MNAPCASPARASSRTRSSAVGPTFAAGALCVVAVFLAPLLPTTGAAAQESRIILEVEGGPAWQSSNNVEVPNDGTATRFSLPDVVGTGHTWAGRMYLTWRLTDRSDLRVLYAPLSFTETGTPGGPLRFADEDFVGGTPVEARYTFNSYRVSYRWRARSSDRADYWIGGTAKIRDATIKLDQGSVSGRTDDVGFVPLLHLAADWRLGPGLHVSADVDALAGGPGRAIDGALKIGYEMGDGWSLRVGYRTVEGGADVDSVYNFAWINYAVASVVWRW